MQNKLLKIKTILEDIFYSGKMHKLTQVEAEILVSCYNDFVKRHTTETFNTSVANVFKKAGFTVVDPHDTEVNYIISI